MSKEAMKLALEALECTEYPQDHYDAITALREALAEQPAQQEPVAKHYVDGGHLVYPTAQRTWVGLNDDELADFWFKQSLDWMEFARVIEDALRSKNT